MNIEKSLEYMPLSHKDKVGTHIALLIAEGMLYKGGTKWIAGMDLKVVCGSPR